MKAAAPIAAGIAALAFSGLLQGCAVVDFAVNGDRLESLKGKSLGDFDRTVALTFHNGQLIAAHAGDAPGIAVIDTGSGKVVDFYSRSLPPVSMAYDTAERLFVIRADYETRAVGWIGVDEGTFHDLPDPVWENSRLLPSGAGLYVADQRETSAYGVRANYLSEIPSRETGGFTGPEQVAFGAWRPLDVAETPGALFVSLQNSRHLRVLSRPISAQGAQDSAALTLPGDSLQAYGFSVHTMTAWNGYVFAAVTRGYSLEDSGSYVAVINAATRALVKIIPLQFRYPHLGTVRNGIWYLCSSGWDFTEDYWGDPVLDGGVEAIDLAAQAHAGVILTEAALGGNLEGFVSTAPGTGYAIYAPGPVGENRKLRKVSF